MCSRKWTGVLVEGGSVEEKSRDRTTTSPFTEMLIDADIVTRNKTVVMLS